MILQDGTLVGVVVGALPVAAGTIGNRQRCGFSVRPQHGADSIREVRPVPVVCVGKAVGLTSLQDETMRDFNVLQDVANPTPSKQNPAGLDQVPNDAELLLLSREATRSSLRCRRTE